MATATLIPARSAVDQATAQSLLIQHVGRLIKADVTVNVGCIEKARRRGKNPAIIRHIQAAAEVLESTGWTQHAAPFDGPHSLFDAFDTAAVAGHGNYETKHRAIDYFDLLVMALTGRQGGVHAWQSAEGRTYADVQRLLGFAIELIRSRTR